MLSFDDIESLLAYAPETGEITWKVDGFRRVKGQIAGTMRNGYQFITISGQEYMGGRIAWLLTHKEWPATRVRFRDNNGSNQRLDNLYVDAFKWQTKEAKNQKSRERRIADPDYFRHHDLKKDFGIGLAEYAALLQEQKGVCAICEKPETAIRNGKIKMLAVDHCHIHGHNRALLCADCNLGIGRFHDDPALLRRAADYLEKHAAKIVPLRKDTA